VKNGTFLHANIIGY